MEAEKNPQWVKLELDVTGFDEALFTHYVDRCLGQGITFVTLADLGDTDDHRLALYELNKECSADIPERGQFYSREEYFLERIEVPTFSPRGVMIVRDGEQWVGMAVLSDGREKGYAFSEMTGVTRPYRGRGIAISMKVLGVAFVRDCGLDVVRTVHHPKNEAMIALNRQLGYVDGTWQFP